ncbi:extracellular solute-binding protein [Leifsonia poae]|uniref:ABC transporter substrate-binding protein n=1 Tax=Leifsonia poae TaxID=110933 RepID=UPI003D670723
MKKVSLVGAVAAFAAAALAMTGCTGGAPGSGSAGEKNHITYLIGQPDTPEQLAAIKKDIAKFEKESGVTVKLNVSPGDSIRTLLQTQLRSGNGPDVFGYDTGPGFAGVLAKAGLLYDMTDQYKKQNYPIYTWAKDTVTFDGKVSGIPDQIEEVGLFYNKDIFAKYGLEVPKNLADLETIADTLKSKGIIPFALGDKEGWEGGHMLSMSLASRVGAEEETKLIAGDSDWSSDGVVASINTWKEFKDKAWIPPSAGAITYNNANALFYSGKAAMNPTGTWLVQDLASSTKADIGFIPFPGPDDKGVAIGGLGNGTFMSAKAKDPAAALKFMDYLVSPDHGQWAVNQYLIPAYPVDTSNVKTSPLFQQVIADTAEYAKGTGGVGQNIDVSSTDVFNKAMWDGMQGVLAGKLTPEQVAKNLQTAATAKTK